MSEIISSLTIIFLASSITLFIANRFNQPAIPAYIVAGITSSYFIDYSNLLELAQLGIAFLVFIFGLKFDPQKLRKLEAETRAATSIQILVIGVISFIFAYILGFELLHSFYFSIAATLSSSLVGLELLEKERNYELIHGRISESINLFQDILAVIAIIILSTPVFTYSEVGHTLLYGIAILTAAFIVRRYIFDFIARQAEGSTELLMLTGLSFLVGFIALTDYLGFSIAIGAFAAGIAVAKFPHNLEIIDTMGSIKDFFSAVFFVTLGALVTFPGAETLLLAALLIIFTMVLKPFLIATALIHQGYDSRTSYITGLSLDQISEFSLIIAIQAYLTGMMTEPMFQGIILAATFTMITSSYTTLYRNRTYDILSKYSLFDTTNRKITPSTNKDGELENHVIVLGYDIQGKKLIETLKDQEKPFITIDNDPEKIAEAREKGENYVYGNAIDRETWEKADYRKADIILSTAPFGPVSEKILELETDAEKILRTEEPEEAEKHLHNGASYVSVPDILSADLLEEHLRGILNDREYREELRRRNLLEVRRYLQSEEG